MKRCAGVWCSEEEAFGCLAGLTRRGPRFLKFFRQPLWGRPGGREEGMSTVLAALRAPVVLCYSGPDLAVRCLRVPRLAPRDIASTAFWEMELLLGGRTEKTLVRHTLLGPSGDDGVDILACAVPEESARGLARSCSGRARVIAVDVEACGLWRIAQFAGAVPVKDGAVAIAAASSSGAVVVAGREHMEFAIAIPGATSRQLDQAISYWESQQNLRVTVRLWAGPAPPQGWSLLHVPDVTPDFHLAAAFALHPWVEPRVDLLAGGLVERGSIKRVLPWALVGALVISSAVLGGLALNYRLEAARLEEETGHLSSSASRSAEVAEQLAEVTSWSDVVADFLVGLPSRSQLASVVSRSVPADAWLTRVDLLPGKEDKDKEDKSIGQEKGPKLPPSGDVLVVEGRCLSVPAAGVLRDALRRELGSEVRVVRIVWDDTLRCYSFRLEIALGGEGK